MTVLRYWRALVVGLLTIGGTFVPSGPCASPVPPLVGIALAQFWARFPQGKRPSTGQTGQSEDSKTRWV